MSEKKKENKKIQNNYKFFTLCRIRLMDEIGKKMNFVIIIIVILFCYFPARYLINFLSFPYPIEYREVASVFPAVGFSNGINPYTLLNFPEHIYLYGVFYPLILAPFITLTTNPLIAARWLNFIFLVLFLLLSYWIFRKRNTSANSSLIGLLILLNSMCYIWKLNGVRPDAPGLFFAFGAFVFILKKNLNIKSIFLSAVYCVVSFYFKQYFLFSALLIAIYLFFFGSKKNGYIFILFTTLLLIASFSLIRRIYPLYYEYSILHHIAVAGTDVKLMENQSTEFFRYFWVLCFIYILNLFTYIKSEFNINLLKRIRISPFEINEPFIINFDVDPFNAGIFISIFILTISLGKHNGNSYTYYGELLLPLLLYFVIPKIDKKILIIPFKTLTIIKNKINENHRVSPNVEIIRVFIQVIILFFCIFPFRLNYSTNFSRWSDAYSTMWKYIESCKNIYDDTPLISLYKLEHNLSPLYNNGQIEYSRTAFPVGSKIFEKISSVPSEFVDQSLQNWNHKIMNKIMARKFDCIFTEKNTLFYNYKKDAEFDNLLGYKIYVQIPESPNH